MYSAGLEMKQHDQQQLKNILFTSVVGPYGVSGKWSRYKNPMSLLTNQVTRGQLYFQVEMSCNTWAFDLFAANINANSAILDFPSVEQLKKVLSSGHWDRVGISGIIPNFDALLKTYEVIRSVLPNTPIDVGGHIANDEQVINELSKNMKDMHPDESFITYSTGEELPSAPLKSVTFVKRDGLEYYSKLEGVGLKDKNKFFEPLPIASVGKRVMGLSVESSSSGLIITDLGCPMKCDFCSTSHKFNGKFIPFLNTAEDLMAVANAHAKEGRTEMFIMSENFSLDHERARKLLKLMEEQKQAFTFNVFSSAKGLVDLGIENIVKLGYCFVWIGLEEASGETYKKMHDIDLHKLISDLQDHGVEVLGSTILGFEHQTKEDLDREIEHALTYNCVYNQFMLYMPVPGTALWDNMKKEGKLKKDFPWIETHGQSVQNWHHPKISDQDIESRLDGAFKKDYEQLGPSLYRMMRVHLNGYLKTADWDHELVQIRRQRMKKNFLLYIPILHAMYKDLKKSGHQIADEVKELKRSLISICGLKGRLSSIVISPYIRISLSKAKRRFKKNEYLKRKTSPKCMLTHYGAFNNKYPSGVPIPQNGRGVVEISRPCNN